MHRSGYLRRARFGEDGEWIVNAMPEDAHRWN
jgi:hypothetical protein